MHPGYFQWLGVTSNGFEPIGSDPFPRERGKGTDQARRAAGQSAVSGDLNLHGADRQLDSLPQGLRRRVAARASHKMFDDAVEVVLGQAWTALDQMLAYLGTTGIIGLVVEEEIEVGQDVGAVACMMPAATHYRSPAPEAAIPRSRA